MILLVETESLYILGHRGDEDNHFKEGKSEGGEGELVSYSGSEVVSKANILFT